MSVEYFIDTNLFIYQLETQDKAKAAIANRIIRAGIETGNACISFQVVQECLNTIIRKLTLSVRLDRWGWRSNAWVTTVKITDAQSL